MSATNDFVAAYTDVYFKRTRRIVERFGDRSVTYAVFMRRPVLATLKLAIDWIEAMARLRGVEIVIEPCHEEGSWVGAGEPLMYITGPMSALVELETVYLQRLGAPCVAAYNAWSMAVALPRAAFLAMDARHCAGAEMAEMMAYAASVGSAAAQAEGAVGFIGNATDATAVHFGNAHGFGTMPHALIGYAGSTLRAAEMFVDTFPGDALTVLVDYYGAEITDALAVCRRFPEMAAAGKLSVRLDTHGGRFLEGLDPALSYAALERNRPDAIRRYRSETELKWLLGPGVSAAAIFQMRNALDDAGFDKVRIVASSGFGPEKCRVMGSVEAPIDVVGTGSFLPEKWSETYATADIVSYDGRESVKVGREFLLPSRRPRR
ncbi:MAG: nicotinate phosphoribosyltransferase [Tistrella sp.]|jgi:nicotinate phosphoribosyltransferase|uniref:Nicotinate phosphoribosyltransferase n=3 Tax=Tistrella mobilis TaxID=171437 RepID=I3TN00_TISMK|nr:MULTISPECIES: nicotinate phosphoribosyltransferase [Tistrella]AFK54138.1 nicotinate phosphoribosyltransferase [Tistrella mobilis KA081020-065]KYO49716.1 nicotinate phosphoribosyltransferase [Tistrella mobilis]MAD39483.1 nicotinate phosphoribosyltransferase [Tistrella sp.]MAM74910.1 nicotinate phosphoribosyltransferase [Tistrella sp.]MBA74828.1 nicotinate phosphoribosyltransferase [Tistrella sp.]